MSSSTSSASSAPESAASKLRRMIEDPNEFIVGPGVHDGVSARIALETGFDVLYMTGAGTVASRLGQPDIGLAGLSDMRAHAEMIANLNPSIPLIADMDTGYGGPSNIHRAVTEYVRAGIAAFHIEDQIQQKRCGHLANKQLVFTSEFLARIRSAASARAASHSDIVIIARTDALASHGYDEALARLRAAHQAGADVLFLEGITSKEMCAAAVRDLAPVPVLLNMVEKGATPLLSVDEARAVGFKMIIWPFAGLVPAIVAMRQAYQGLKTSGVVPGQKMTPKEIFELCGLKEWVEVDREAGGEIFRNGV